MVLIYRLFCVLALCLLFSFNSVKAVSVYDQHEETLMDGLSEVFQEPAFSRIMEWLKLEEERGATELASYTLVKYSLCKDKSPRECVLSEYMNLFMQGQARIRFYHPFYLFLGFTFCCTCRYRAGLINAIGNISNLSILHGFLALSAFSLISVLGYVAYSIEAAPLHHLIRSAAIHVPLEEARRDYLELILVLMKYSLSDRKIVAEQSITFAAPITVIKSDNDKVDTHLLASYKRHNFSGNGRQVVMRDNKMNHSVFFKVFIRNIPADNHLEKMQLILESSGRRFTLTVDQFTLSPLLDLLDKLGVEKIQLLKVQDDFIY